jgi:quercetin dioxygenase-like cupin family protein
MLLPVSLGAFSRERIFVLVDQNHILQYRTDPGGGISLTKTYTRRELPPAFPAKRIAMKSGNILCTYDEQGNLAARLLYNPSTDELTVYDGNPGEPSSLGGRILETPSLKEPFRGAQSYYSSPRNKYRESLLLDDYRQRAGSQCQDLFVLEGNFFCVAGNHIDRISAKDGSSEPARKSQASPAPAKPNGMDPRYERALDLPDARLVAAAVSPWDEVFISDSATNSLQRVIWRNGRLEPNGSLRGKDLISPGALEFSPDGTLFVANTSGGSRMGILRYRFTLSNFVNWAAAEEGGIGLDGTGALSLALSKPVGFVVSEKVLRLERAPQAESRNIHGLSETGVFDPESNSEAAVIGFIQYDPDGYHPVHFHPQMEQIAIVVEGRALWEVGEIEKEVGPGDIIFNPRYSKHGYKILGNTPFRYLEVEWILKDPR